MEVIKRNGNSAAFDKAKIYNAIMKAMMFGSGVIREDIARRIADGIEEVAYSVPESLTIQNIETMVFHRLVECGEKLTAKYYEGYRSVREFQRNSKNTTDKELKELLNGESDYWNNENSNKNAKLVTTVRDYMAGIESTDLARRVILPPDVVQAHDEGIIHFHDMDYLAQDTHNCCLINLDDMLQNGTVISGVKIEKPHSFSTACTIATQIIAQVASSQFGGQTISLAHLAPFVNVSRQKIRKQLEGIESESIDKLADNLLKDEITKGIQTIQYQVVTLMTTNGQAPFLTVYADIGEVEDELTKNDLALIIEEVLKQRIQGVKNEVGVYITPAFPKLIYALREENVNEDSKYYYLTKLAAQCTAKRMVPDYISGKKMEEYKINKFGVGDIYPCMGCRSFLTPDRTTSNMARALNYKADKGKYYGRFNLGVVTLNLPDIALSSHGDMDLFWKIFEIRTELCHKALQVRLKKMTGVTSDVAPILWQHGALARLGKGETIDSLFYNGYATISLGYAGLYECVKYMTGHSHTDHGIGHDFGIQVMEALNAKCQQWKAAENVDYSVYGTPIESTTYKFAKKLQNHFGIIEGITDKNYITNSYHVHVTEEIDAFSKLSIESEFQQLSPGGAISYVEVPNLENNIDVVLQIIRFIYDNIIYAELNTKSDYCQVCGYDKEIKIITDPESGELIWECPNCGNRDHAKMNVARRTCGYIGNNFFNQGRTQEIKERITHVDDKLYEEKS